MVPDGKQAELQVHLHIQVAVVLQVHKLQAAALAALDLQG